MQPAIHFFLDMNTGAFTTVLLFANDGVHAVAKMDTRLSVPVIESNGVELQL